MPVSTLFLGAAVLSALSASVSATKYTLQDDFSGPDFFDGFTFNNASDPTHGYVQYLSYTDAKKADLINFIDGAAFMGVDYYNTYSLTAQGRPSVRIETAKTYNHGLFIVDLAHMPGNACGSWPAFWSLGDGTWPANGEIDIIEGVSKNTNNLQVLHTADNCTIAGADMTGTLATNDCSVSHSTSGCAVNPTVSDTFGDGFNSNGGGVYAMEWTSSAIKMWFFPRGSVPDEISSSNPDTSKFGTPSANFQGSCDIDSHFKNHKFIFDTTFCGDWAGNVYSTSGCPTYSGKSSVDSCVQYVAENPFAFEQSYWLINSFRTFNAAPVVSSSAIPSSSKLSSVLPAASTSAFSLTTISVAMGQTTTPSAPGPKSTSGLAINGTAPIPLPSGLSTGSTSLPSRNATSVRSSSSLPTGIFTSDSKSSSGTLSSKTGSASIPTSIFASSSKSTNGTLPSKTGSGSLGGIQYTTEVVTAYTTYCPAATQVVNNGKTYTVTSATTLTLDCPCTITRPISNSITRSAVPTPSTSAKETVTTVITTSYVDVCPTGYVTSVITHTVTYCPGDITSGAPAPPGFTTKVTVCDACGPARTTVTLTVPVTTPASALVSSATGGTPSPPKSVPVGENSATSAASQPSKSVPTDSAPGVPVTSPAPPPPKSVPAGGNSATGTASQPAKSVPAGSAPGVPATTAKVTQIQTLSVVPVPPSQTVQPSGSAAKPSQPAVSSSSLALPVISSVPAKSSQPAVSSGSLAPPAISSIPAKPSASAPAGGNSYTVPAGGYGGSNKTVSATGTGKVSPSGSLTATPSQFTGGAGQTRAFAGLVGGFIAVGAAVML